MTWDDFVSWYRNWWILKNTPGYNCLGLETRAYKKQMKEEVHKMHENSAYSHLERKQQEQQRDDCLRQAVYEMYEFKQKYIHLSEFKPIFKAMGKVKLDIKY